MPYRGDGTSHSLGASGLLQLKSSVRTPALGASPAYVVRGDCTVHSRQSSVGPTAGAAEGRAIRVAALDDHPATLAGLEALVRAEPDLRWVGSAGSEPEIWALLARAWPDVLVLDLHHPGGDGLALCLQIDSALQAPRLILYSGAAGLDFPARFAGASAVVGKSAPTRALIQAIRATARGDRDRRQIPPLTQASAGAKLAPADRAIFAMRLAGTRPDEMAEVLRLPRAVISARLVTIVARLGRSEIGAPGSGERREMGRAEPPERNGGRDHAGVRLDDLLHDVRPRTEPGVAPLERPR